MSLLDDAQTLMGQTTIDTDLWVKRIWDHTYTQDQIKATKHYQSHKALEAYVKAHPAPAPPPVDPHLAILAKNVMFNAWQAGHAMIAALPGCPNLDHYAMARTADL